MSVTIEKDFENRFSPNPTLSKRGQKWFTRQEACNLKGLNIKTAYNKTELLPNNGEPEGKLGGRDVWSWETVRDWLPLLDDDIRKKEKQAS